MISINFLLAMNRGNSRSAENHVENKKARLSSSTSSRTPDGHVHTFSDYLKTVLDNSPGSCKNIERQEESHILTVTGRGPRTDIYPPKNPFFARAKRGFYW